VSGSASTWRLAFRGRRQTSTPHSHAVSARRFGPTGAAEANRREL